MDVELFALNLAMFYTVKKWFESYVTNRTLMVRFNNELSDSQRVDYGIAQGSCCHGMSYELNYIINK